MNEPFFGHLASDVLKAVEGKCTFPEPVKQGKMIACLVKSIKLFRSSKEIELTFKLKNWLTKSMRRYTSGKEIDQLSQ